MKHRNLSFGTSMLLSALVLELYMAFFKLFISTNPKYSLGSSNLIFFLIYMMDTLISGVVT